MPGIKGENDIGLALEGLIWRSNISSTISKYLSQYSKIPIFIKFLIVLEQMVTLKRVKYECLVESLGLTCLRKIFLVGLL